jgi:hypothetical protein
LLIDLLDYVALLDSGIRSRSRRIDFQDHQPLHVSTYP